MCEGIGRSGSHCLDVCGHSSEHDTYYRCCCESRDLSTTEEELEVLEVYRKRLERRLDSVKEEIAKLKTRT